MDLAAWLESLGLERYTQAFRDNAVDGDVLPTLTDADLEKLGMLLGHRKRLLAAIASLREPRPGNEREPSVSRGRTGTRGRPAEPTAGERRQLTVAFVDLVGSTALAARLDPEEMREILRAYQNAVAGELARVEGHVAKFMGDGVLAYFGWPKAHEDDAERAARAGLAIAEAVAKLPAPGGGMLRARVGIATGLVVVGDLVGDGAAQEEAVVGETPNLAARLQVLADPGHVVIADATRRLLGDVFDLLDLGERELRGISQPVRAWRVVKEGVSRSRFEARHPGRLTPLVGREHELGLLLDRWQQAKTGEGQVALISGEPGIGKSRLAQALRERVRDEPHTRLRYQCSPFHTNSALHPVIEQLERAAGLDREDAVGTKLDKLEALLARSTAAVADVAPLFASLLSIQAEERYPPSGLSPQRQKEKILDALVEQLRALASNRPVLFVYEDLHWIDPTSLELLDRTVERVQTFPVLALLTFRPEFRPPWIGLAHVHSITLNRLPRRQGAAIVEQLSEKALPAEVMEQIVAKTDGVPLFVEELTKTVLESGLLKDRGDRYELAGGPLPPLAIPATVHADGAARPLEAD